MRIAHSFCALIAVVLLAPAADAADKLDLKLNLKKGTVKKMANNVDMKVNVNAGGRNINMTMTMIMDMEVKVTDVDAKKVHTLESKISRVRMNMAGPLQMNYDSNDPNAGGPLAGPFKAIVGKAITSKITENGKTTDVKVPDGLGVGANQIKDQLSQMLALPGKPVAIGDTWKQKVKVAGAQPGQNTAVESTYTLKGRKNGVAEIAIKGKLGGPLGGTMTGTIYVDEKTGWTKTGTMDLKMSGNQGGAQMEMTGKVKFGPPKKK